MDGMNWIFFMRIGLAGLLGGLVGLDREFREKEAGIRTHFLVALGSALLMVISQWGFSGAGTAHMDPSRVAAQVVSGIGFIGAGTILINKRFVRGLTTAAGLWAVAAIGLAAGCGMYFLAIASTVLVLAGLELFFFTRGLKVKNIHVVFITARHEDLVHVTNLMNQNNFQITSFSVDPMENGKFRVSLYMRVHSPETETNTILDLLEHLPGLSIETID